MKVVIDTNVVVSRFLSVGGTPARILRFWEQGVFQIIVSEAMLAEYKKALGYEEVRRRHGFTSDQTNTWVDNLTIYGELVATDEVIRFITDDLDDNKVLECAVAGGADYIVSGDRHLLSLQHYRGIQIVTPA